MLRLRPYLPDDARVITGWLTDEYTFRLWCADRYDRFPITPADMNAYYDREKSGWGMTAFDETGVIGHFTMRFPDADREHIRLGFVIVDERVRGRGYGKEMLSLAIRYAFDCVKVQKISLGVFAQNERAIACYRACGFRPVTRAQTETYRCMGETWVCIEMELHR